MDIKTYFSKVLKSGNGSHFYLLSGEGSVDDALRVLFCENQNACGICSGCKALKSSSVNDLFVLRSEEGGKIKDEEVEEAIRHTQTTASFRYRVVAIYNADRMTVRAQNHLLKSLEEAPRHVIYLMQTESPESLLPTVVSRAIRIRGRRGTYEKSELTDLLLGSDYGKLEDALKSWKERKPAFLSELQKVSEQLTEMWRDRVRAFTTGVLQQCRDLESSDCNIGRGESFGISEENKQSEQWKTIKKIEHLVMRIDEVIRNLEQNANFDLNMDLLIFWEEF